MALLLDIFGFLAVVLGGLSITAQAFTLGSIGFVLLIAKPLHGAIAAGDVILQRSFRILSWSALALAAVELLTVLVQIAILIDTTGVGVAGALGAGFVIAASLRIVAALVIALLARTARGARSTRAGFVLGGLVLVIAATLTSHAAARLDDRLPLA